MAQAALKGKVEAVHEGFAPAVSGRVHRARGERLFQLPEPFSDPGAEKRRAEKKRSRQSGDDDELQSRRYRRDPLDSLVFNDRNKTPSWAERDLSDGERSALRNALDPNERSSQKAIDQVYLENERSRKKRTDWVFGPNPFRK